MLSFRKWFREIFIRLKSLNLTIETENGKNGVDLDVNKIREQLIMENAEILHNIRDDNGLPLHINPDRDDMAHDYITLEKNIALKAIEREQLQRIEEALHRLDDSTYGLCNECGHDIPLERLEILPYATLCVNCQTRHERRC